MISEKTTFTFYPEISGLAIQYFTFYIPLANKNHKSFFMSRLTTSPFGGLRGLTNCFTAENRLSRVYAELFFYFHERMIIFYPQSHFYILPRDFGAGYSIFYILHFPKPIKTNIFFISGMKNFPLREIEWVSKPQIEQNQNFFLKFLCCLKTSPYLCTPN